MSWVCHYTRVYRYGRVAHSYVPISTPVMSYVRVTSSSRRNIILIGCIVITCVDLFDYFPKSCRAAEWSALSVPKSQFSGSQHGTNSGLLRLYCDQKCIVDHIKYDVRWTRRLSIKIWSHVPFVNEQKYHIVWCTFTTQPTNLIKRNRRTRKCLVWVHTFRGKEGAFDTNVVFM